MNSCSSIGNAGKWLLAVLLCLCAAQAYASAAAIVLFSHGSVHAMNDDGQRHALTKGDDVLSGDTITTGRDGRIQMRFSDGGLVSLMPGSKFAVEEYQRPTTESDGSLVFNLVEGGLRTLTGSIGHKDHGDYKLKTSVATLGIRGTQFFVVMDGDVMRIHVGHGKVKIFNDSGRLFLTSGENGIVIPGKKPEKTSEEPNYISSAETYVIDTSENKDSGDKASGAGLNNNAMALGDTTVVYNLPPDIINGSGAVHEDMAGGGTTSGDGTTPGGSGSPGSGYTPANPGFVIAYRPAGGAPPMGTSYSKEQWQDAIQSADGELPSDVPDFLPVKPDTPIGDIQANGSTVHKTGTLVWGEVLTSTNQSGTWSYYQPYVWGIPTANVPSSGTLNYTLADATAVRYTHAGVSSSGTLKAFRLLIDLNGAGAPLFRAGLGMEVDSRTLGLYMRSSVAGTMDGASFKFRSDLISGDFCYNCRLSVAGLLSGTNAEQAGVVYKLLDRLNAPDAAVGVYTGAAVLHKVPNEPPQPPG